jgi:hypothetical protein
MSIKIEKHRESVNKAWLSANREWVIPMIEKAIAEQHSSYAPTSLRRVMELLMWTKPYVTLNKMTAYFMPTWIDEAMSVDRKAANHTAFWDASTMRQRGTSSQFN